MLLEKIAKLFMRHQSVDQSKKGNIINLVFKLGRWEVLVLDLDVSCECCTCKKE